METGYLLHSGKHLFLFTWSKPSQVLWETVAGVGSGVGGGRLGELAGTATRLWWGGNCSVLKCLRSILIKRQTLKEASQMMFRNWNLDCCKSPCWKIHPLSDSKTIYFGIFLDECNITTIIQLSSPELKCISWSKDGKYVANVCQLLPHTHDRHH